MSNVELKALSFFAGVALLLVGLAGRGVMGLAMANTSCDSTSRGLAWILWSPLLILGFYLIILAGTTP
jgi:hypothetical protein